MILEQTEADMLKAQQEGLLIANHLKSLRQTLNQQNQKKFELEEQILELLQDQITTDKAGESQGKTLRETQEKRRELEIGMSDTEHKLSIALLDLEKWRGIVEKSKGEVSQIKVINCLDMLWMFRTESLFYRKNTILWTTRRESTTMKSRSLRK